MNSVRFAGDVRRPGRKSLATRLAGVLFLILHIACQNSANAGNKDKIKEAAALMERGDYAPAYCIWMDLADDGVTEAQYILGWMYNNGYGVAIDDKRAREWWAEAADEGHVEAQFSLAMSLSQGSSGSKDLDQAVKWYSKAAQNGHEDASLVLLAMANQGDAAASDAVKRLAKKGQIGTNVKISVDLANIREKPSTKSHRLATLKKGARLIDFGRSGKWHKVWVPELARVAWVHEGLLE